MSLELNSEGIQRMYTRTFLPKLHAATRRICLSTVKFLQRLLSKLSATPRLSTRKSTRIPQAIGTARARSTEKARALDSLSKMPSSRFQRPYLDTTHLSKESKFTSTSLKLGSAIHPTTCSGRRAIDPSGNSSGFPALWVWYRAAALSKAEARACSMSYLKRAHSGTRPIAATWSTGTKLEQMPQPVGPASL